jgi:peptidoglycan/LPS O-acetylase OafA/YrhL
MGAIRFLLALSVVIFHSSPIFGWELVHGGLAVESFFIISGFYMSLVLHEKYPVGKAMTFFENRFWRLFPAYWIILFFGVIGNLAIYIISGKSIYTLKLWIEQIQFHNWTVLIPLGLSNLIFFGQELYHLTAFTAQGIPHFLKPVGSSLISGKSYLFLPQAWSISVELQFYLLAPCLVRLRWPKMLGVLLLSLGARWWAWNVYDPEMAQNICYSILPTQLYLFMLGSIGYRVYRYLRDSQKEIYMQGARVCWVGFIILIAIFQFWPGTLLQKEVMLVILTACATPFTFLATRRILWDRLLGELGYPIYIIHVTIEQFSDRVLDRWGWHERGVVLSVLTITASFLLYRLVDAPLDGWRASWTQRRLSQ